MFIHFHLLHPFNYFSDCELVKSWPRNYYFNIIILLGWFHNKNPMLSLVSMTFGKPSAFAISSTARRTATFWASSFRVFGFGLCHEWPFILMSWHLKDKDGRISRNIRAPPRHWMSDNFVLLSLTLIYIHFIFSRVNSSVSNLIWDAKVSYEYEILSHTKHSEY